MSLRSILPIAALLFIATLAQATAQATTGYVCGVTDGRSRDFFKSTDLTALQQYTERYCQTHSKTGQCSSVACQSFTVERGFEVGRTIERSSVLEQASHARPAPRPRGEDRSEDGINAALEGVAAAERERDRHDFEEILREHREHSGAGHGHRRPR